MKRERLLRFQVDSHEELERIARAPLPLELRETSADIDFYRLVYFDTPTGDLERKGARVLLCIRPDERKLLRVDIGTPEGGADTVVRRHAEAEVPALPPADLFLGDSEPARMIRALVDPAHLKPVIELETMRRLRTARTDEPDETVTFTFETVTVRKGDLSGELYELEVMIDSVRERAFEGAVEEIESAYGVRLTLADTVARAHWLIDQLAIERLEQDVRAAREVAVIAYDQGRIALFRNAEGLRVPTGHGSGQDACRRVLRRLFGRAHARIRLLGTTPGMEDRPALEVWLAEGAHGAAPGCVWIPLDVMLGRVGSRQLRNARTLAALHAVARSDLPSRQFNGASSNGARPAASPIFEHVVSVSKLSALFEQAVPEKVAPELLFNPELSRLAFDERILVIAEDDETPLLECVRFLSMFGSRVDDFFMTRIAEFKKAVASGSDDHSIDGLTPAMQLDVARIRARQVKERAYRLWRERLLPQLESRGISILRWADLEPHDREHVKKTTTREAETVITPVVADPAHPFPHLRNLRPAIAAVLRLPESNDEHFVAIELPSGLPRFVPLPGGDRFVPLEAIILASLPDLYPGLEVVQAGTFRVTRSAVLELEDEPAGGVLAAVEEEVARRPFGEVVRLEVDDAMPQSLRDRLLRELQFELPDVETALTEDDVHVVAGPVDLAALRELAELDRRELHYRPIRHTSPLAADRSIFDQIRERDIFVRFPEHDFGDTVERLLEEAAEDPNVVSMKITLYRTNPASRLVQALAKARAAGKDAFALIELKASFDERANTEWARSLQAAGIHVVFSPSKIKVHAKVALVVRREGDELRRYVYIGTGNLNAATARGYTDVGVLTARDELAEEVNAVFNLLTGYSASRDFRRLLVSPFTMRSRFLELLEREVEHARNGRGGRVRIQINGLADRRMIGALYRASQAGVEIDMAVREICCLRPGVPQLSENIRVVSLLGRFLQHARIFCFHNAGEPEYYMGSADWRPRNLSKRVEVVTPVLDPAHCEELDRMLEHVLRHDDAWELTPDGAWVRDAEVIAGEQALAAPTPLNRPGPGTSAAVMGHYGS